MNPAKKYFHEPRSTGLPALAGRLLAVCLVLTGMTLAVYLGTQAHANDEFSHEGEKKATPVLATDPGNNAFIYLPMKGPDGTNTNLRLLKLWWKNNHTADLTVALTTDSNRISFWNQPTDADPAAQITQVALTEKNNDQYNNSVTVYLRADQPGDDVIHFMTTGTPATKLAGDVHLTVVEVDLDVDTNNDGSIDTTNTGEDRYEEYEPGVLVCKTPGDISNPFHHNGRLNLKVDAGGSSYMAGCTITMEAAPPGNNKIYTSSVTQDLSTFVKLQNHPSPTVWDMTSLPATLWVRGATIGWWPVKLICKDPSGNIIKTDTVGIYVVPYVNIAPDAFTNQVSSWCPFWKTGEYDSALHSTLETILDKLAGHGWDTSSCKFTDEQGDATTGNCTLANLKSTMPNGGVIVMCTHGFESPLPLAGSAALVAFAFGDYSDANTWKGSESGLGVSDMKIKAGSGFLWRTVVYAKPDWFGANWSASPDGNNALVCFLMCYSDNVLGYVGGRMSFAYSSSVLWSVMGSDMNQLFGKLTGGSGGTARNVNDILLHTTFSPTLKHSGNPYTTLNPAPVNIKPGTNPFGTFPSSTVTENRRGAGAIVFDTYMDATQTASSALTGSTPVRWVDNGNGAFALSFDFDKTGGAAIHMDAEADHCLNEGLLPAGRRKMDGDRTTYGSDVGWSF